MKTVIVGVGQMGSVLVNLASSAGHEVYPWDHTVGKVPNQVPLEQSVPDADLIMLCAPARATATLGELLRPLIQKPTPVVSLSKGLDPVSGQVVPTILQKILPIAQLGLLYGPMLAEEIAEKQIGFGVVAAAEQQVFTTIKKVFGTALFLEYSDDVFSIAWLGVLKNVYALVEGICDGLGMGCNARGWLMTQAVREMRTWLWQVKGAPKWVLSYAGIGDLVATSISQRSHNHMAGEQLARGEMPLEAEGFYTIKILRSHWSTLIELCPVLMAAEKIVRAPHLAHTVMQTVMEKN